MTPQRIAITGGASGIGRATALRLRAGGARVTVLDLDISDGDESIVVDVADPKAVASAIDRAAESMGGLDGLVACAGVFVGGTVTEVSVDEWDHAFAVNARGLYLSGAAAIPHMRRAGGGSIVLIASQLGLVAGPNMAAYCASKGAAISLTRAMAVDHAAEGIRVNCVCPGPTDTPLLRRHIDGADDPAAALAGYEALQLHSRLVEADEVADAVAYLMSPRAGSTIGTAMVVDGGYVAR